ncbi:MAG: hypothetical protein FJW23_13960 [Acidimicrobiia bacterium]|nr:hypothetical protein [Acidimicrobiia bacterium]
MPEPFDQTLRATVDRTVRELTDRLSRQLADAARVRTSRWLGGVRAIDAAASLSQALDALLVAASGEAERVAILVGGDALRGWRSHGFGEVDPATLTTTAADLRALPAASESYALAPADESRQPPFARGHGLRLALALEVSVEGKPVAILYADAPPPGPGASAPLWPGALEMLTRHTSRVLETLMVRQAAQLSVSR